MKKEAITPIPPKRKLSREEVFQLCAVAGVIIGVCALLSLNPSVGTSFLLSIVSASLLSPFVNGIERRGHSRGIAILIVLGLLGVLIFFGVAQGTQAITEQWGDFERQVPGYYKSALSRIQGWESTIHSKFTFLKMVSISQALKSNADNTGQWFMNHAPTLMGQFLTSLFLVPLFTLFLLKDGRGIQRRFFALVPNRFFEKTFMVISQVGSVVTDYVRAKLIEASLVGFLTLIGLVIVGAPYAVILAVIAALTNIIPYLGPILGAIPGILIPLIEPHYVNLVWPIALVYLIANIVDTVVIFPLVVAKLVNLHPLLLIAAVMIGQEYYGMVGMLISIPIASILKVVATELYLIIYADRSARSSHSSP